MTVTFRVDEVEPAREPLPTRRFAERIGDVLTFGGDPELAVVDHGSTHPLLGAVGLAFAQHRPLVLSPDVVWLTIAQGVAQHVRLHAEALRPRLVRHAGKKELVVEWIGQMPTDAASWTEIVGRFRDAVGEEVGDGRARLLECDFSTTTEVERVAIRIVLMDVYSPYFDFRMTCICGIPEITLLGTVDDWRAIRERVDVVAELDLGWWTASLAPIADQLVRAAAGEPDVAFWKRIYNPRDAYGGAVITGWITRLYPYLQVNGQIRDRNPMLELPIDEPRGHAAGTDYHGPGIASDVVPAGPSTARVRVRDIDHRERRIALDGGVLAVAQDAAGRLQPVCGWLVREPESSIGEIVDRIRAEHRAIPVPERDWREQMRISGPADLVGLYAQLDGAVLFEGDAPWRIRGLAEWQEVEIGLPNGGSCQVRRLIDLPDGTYLAFLDAWSPVFVRGRADAVVEPTGDELIVGFRRSTQPAAEIAVAGTSLLDLLGAALDSGGALEFPAQGSLLDTFDRPPPGY